MPLWLAVCCEVLQKCFRTLVGVVLQMCFRTLVGYHAGLILAYVKPSNRLLSVGKPRNTPKASSIKSVWLQGKSS